MSVSSACKRWTGFLLLVGAGLSPAWSAVPPPRRELAEVKAVLAQAPKPPAARELRALNVLLVANRKDHGAHEHDYPRWMERWKVLLGGEQAGSAPVTLYGPTSDLPPGPRPGAPKVRVETAVDWPTPEQLRRADVVVAFMGTGGIWNEAKLRDLRALLDRGAGFVALHAAVIAEKPHAEPLADLLGLAWESGRTLFRHGPLDLKISDPSHPITRGLPERIHFEDESYWPLIGDASRVQVLATAEEATPGTGQLAPHPMFWTHTVGKGRVFNSIPGHYSWTFDDPYFRLLVLRGTAWAAGESPYRFDPLALSGARTTTRKPEVVKTAQEPAAPVAPNAADPDLLLWLDAADRATVTTGADGRVSAWASKAGRVTARLTSTGARQPVYAAEALGGRPAVRFDGMDDVLRDTAFRQASKEWTLALVVTPRSNAGQFRSLLAANRPGQDDFQTGFNLDLGPTATPAFNAVNIEGIKGGGATNLRTGAAPFGSGQVLVLSTGSGSSRLWVNGQEEEARGASDALTVMEELRLGGRFYLGQERGHFHGDVSEVLIYRTALTEAQRAGLTAHLIQKYGPAIQPPVTVALDPWDYLPAYDWGMTRRPLGPIEEAVTRAGADRRARQALEARLLEVLGDPANTAAARDFVCRQLAVVGSAASVPTLAKLLGDPVLTPMACFALERIPSAEAERALIQALERAPVGARVELIQTLGHRGSRGAVPHLAPLLRDAEASVRSAAIVALGSIGGPSAAAALSAALDQAPASEAPVLAAALLKCAEQSEGQDAARLYERLRRPDVPQPARRAAVRATILLRGAAGVPLLLEQLHAGDPEGRAAMLLLIRELPGPEVTTAIASRLGRLPAEAQALAITALADRGDPAAAPAVRDTLRLGNPAVRLTAAQALGRLGDETDVPMLLAEAGGTDPELAAAARGSLAALSGDAVDAALLRSVEQGDVKRRAAAVEALGRRGHAAAGPLLLRTARGDEPALRVAALRALGETAGTAETPALVELLTGTDDPREIQSAERALATVYARTREKDRWADALLAGLGGAKGEAKAALLRSLALHGGPKALAAVRAAVGDPDPELQNEALGLLTDWPTPDAAEALLSLTQSANPTHRTLALRGYLRMAALPAVPAERRLEMSRQGLALAQRDDERRLALAALTGVPAVEALRTALPLLAQEGVAEEAGAAVVAISGKLLPEHAALVIEAMDQVLARVENAELKTQATELRARAAQVRR
ncbi:MAG: HEAT repeat domain-containing protein [Armatimonadota bacterium]